MTYSWPCGCGVMARGGVGTHRHTCGIVAKVTENGDVGCNIELDRSAARPPAKFVVRDGEMIRQEAGEGQQQ